MNLSAALQYLFPAAVPGVDFRVVDHSDGLGFRIAEWALAEPWPTEQELVDAWVAVQAKKQAADALYAARLAMADLFHQLADAVRAYHNADYVICEAAIIRGDLASAKLHLQSMTVCPLIPSDEREPLRSQFLAFFPA